MQKDIFIIGITGRSSSGKSTLAQELHQALKNESIHIDIDQFLWSSAEFNCQNPSEREIQALKEINQELEKLKEGKDAIFSIFDCHYKRKINKPPVSYHSAEIIIIEGTLVLWSELIRNLLDLKIIVDVPNEVCLQRRLERHFNRLSNTNFEHERDKLKGKILARWVTISEQWDRYLDFESRKHADIIIPHPEKGAPRILSIVESFWPESRDRDCLKEDFRPQ